MKIAFKKMRKNIIDMIIITSGLYISDTISRNEISSYFINLYYKAKYHNVGLDDYRRAKGIWNYKLNSQKVEFTGNIMMMW